MAVRKTKHEMPEQSPKERIKNFKEVPYGYNAETAIEEAKRCLQCKNSPCVNGCPVEIDIPDFIKHIADGDLDKAVKELKTKTSLPAVCGRVCPYENQCEGECTLLKIGEPVAIGRLERFLADYEREKGVTIPKKAKSTGKKYDTPVKIGKIVATFGAGNVAMDCARTSLRLGAEKSYIIYRRSDVEMPARNEEIEHAREEGVIFKLLTNPIKFIGDDKGLLTQVECIKMKLGEPDDSGRRRPIPIPGSEKTIKIDTALVAIGQSPNPLIPQTVKGLKMGKWGNIKTDEDGRTSIPGLFAGGDIATGAATVILAMGAGKRSARAIDEYLKTKK